MLERQVEERALGGRQSPVEAGVDGRDRDREGPFVVCERRSLATLEVARKLIEE